jgi:hypothetical protein
VSNIGHNLPPIVAPADTEMLADLNARYPEVQRELDAFEKALATFPTTDLTLKDEDIAAALQDLLGKMAKQKSVFSAHKKTEKKPWDTLVKVVQNFFGKGEEKIDALLAEWKPRHEAFLALKKAEALRAAEAEATRLREKEEADRRAAALAEEKRLAAEEEERKARQREEEARAAEEKAKADQRAAEERAAAAQAEEKRIAEEKKARDREEKSRNETLLREVKAAMKVAERLHALAEAGEASDAETAELDEMIRPGGPISAKGSAVAASRLLDDDQKADAAASRTRLLVLRDAGSARFSKKEQRRREKEKAEADAREKAEAEERAARRAEDEERSRLAREAREKAEAEALEARAAGQAAKEEAREARSDAREAVQEKKGAAKAVQLHEAAADQAANRGDRLERRIENSTDADLSRTRGDLGTVGSLARRWTYTITDEDALRAVCGPLGEHFTFDALGGAAYRWMGAHRENFKGDRVEGALPGVVFMHEVESRIA